jgi:predicted transcriptional regulator of viral defense system
MKKPPDYAHLYAIAEDQAGYFTSSQAKEAGYSLERLSDLAARGKFSRIQRGIYRLSYFPANRFADLFIALLRTSPASVISHDSALAVYELSDVLPTQTHVIMPRTASRRREGLRLHTHQLEPDEVTRREGLRITTVERTIADVIAGGVAIQHVRQAIQQALHRGLTTRERLIEQAHRRKGEVEKMILKTLEEIGQ